MFPSINIVGSWVMWNNSTRIPVRLPVGTKLHTSRYIIDKMNEIAVVNGITRSDALYNIEKRPVDYMQEVTEPREDLVVSCDGDG